MFCFSLRLDETKTLVKKKNGTTAVTRVGNFGKKLPPKLKRILSKFKIMGQKNNNNNNTLAQLN